MRFFNAIEFSKQCCKLHDVVKHKNKNKYHSKHNEYTINIPVKPTKTVKSIENFKNTHEQIYIYTNSIMNT